jgi:hypothetical protein
MEEVRGQQAPPHAHEVIPYEYHFDFVSILKSLETEDLVLKHTKSLSSNQTITACYHHFLIPLFFNDFGK